jgi:hypothetical protein
MAWITPDKYKNNCEDINLKFMKELKGELSDKQAKTTLAEFLRKNIGFTVELITGGDSKLAEFQEVLLKGVLNRNFSMFLMGRGLSKSYLAGHLAYLVPLFEPGTNVMIAAPTFRGARNVFGYLEKIANSKNATMLRQMFGSEPSRRNDLLEWPIIGNTCISSIRATPLNSKIRGFRANLLLIDEYLLLSEEIIKNVLLPFLVAPSNIKERLEVREIEDQMIKDGKITEDQRMTFPNQSRMVALTSASYTFENLFTTYTEWLDNILNESKPVGDAKYFIAQMGYKSVPKYMVDQTIIEEAANGGEESPSFQREYCARFFDGGESYFSAKKLNEQTIKPGDYPTLLLKGDPKVKYILSIDPNFKDSPTSDFFAMAIGAIDEVKNEVTLVHNYGRTGAGLKNHIRYFLYLLKAFDPVFIISDNSDGRFIDSANESDLLKNEGINIQNIDYDGSLQGEEYVKMLKQVRKQYNQDAKRICYKQVFNTEENRRMNEQLQTMLNTKKIWFGSRLNNHADGLEAAINESIPYEFEGKDNIMDFIDIQDDLINQVKKQANLIDVYISANGNQRFDFPQHLKRSQSSTRPRKDNYTALLLLIEGFKAYRDLMTQPVHEKLELFVPRLVGGSTLR